MNPLLEYVMRKLWIAAVLLPLAGTLVGHGADKKALDKAKALIDTHAKIILRVAHPTTKFVALDYHGVDDFRDGFRLYYDVNYTSVRKNKHVMKMTFDFSLAGAFSGCKVKSDTGTIAAFTAGDLAADVLKPIVKAKLLLNPKAKDQALQALKGVLFDQATRRYDAKGLLEMWLKSAQEK